jgi:transcriptional regulator with XRE-family HTH domain
MLVEARRKAGLTQAQLAARAGVARSAVAMYERGSREPGAEVFLTLLAAAGSRLELRDFSAQDLRRGRQLADLLELADALPHRWPGDRIEFPAALWGVR